ncbi:T9SS type A sorting domain-containing protein [Longitalea luteola]|uniref:T9SS type A sorting domain-containing protein n=1 Tax=Longitalea luteola TaxID=2812563 RepID=UPI001A95BE02|nr:T9SS type A sorting domain-containing protein [Longitalea luteola]
MNVHRVTAMILLFVCCLDLHANSGYRNDYSPGFSPTPNLLYINQSFYLDGVNGNDVSDGRTMQTAVKSVKRLLSLSIQSGDTIFVARGSQFREFLNTKDLHINNITIMDYGTGPRPVFDAADTAKNNQFTKKAGYQHLYEISWKNNFRDGLDVSQYSVWEDGWRLKRTLSLEQCENTPGSFYAPVVTQSAGTDLITIHARNSDDVVSSNRLYEITRRPMGIHVGDNSRVYNMHTRRNASNNGSFEAGYGCYIYGVLAEDGVKHNFFLGSGTAEKCMAWKSDDPLIFGGNTLFISFSDSRFADTMDVIYKNCVAIAGRNTTDYVQYGAIGLYFHTTGAPYRSHKIKGGVFANTSVAITSEQRDLLIDSVFFINNLAASSKVSGSVTVKNSNIIAASNGAAISSDNVVDSIVFINNKVYMPGVSHMLAKLASGAPRLTRLSDNTVICDCEKELFAVYYNSAGGNLIMERNLMANLNKGAIIGLSSLDPFSKTVIQSKNNHYAAQQDNVRPLKIAYLGANVNYLDLQQIKAAGYESGSVAEPSPVLESRMYGTYSTTDYFLSKNDVLYNECGSSSTFDDINRYPSWLGDTLGILLKTNSDAIIKFLSFSGISSYSGNKLTWQVPLTDKLSYFEVEYSQDGVYFSKVGNLQYERDKQVYEYQHNPPLLSNYYYRIKATTANGSKSYSEQLLLTLNLTEGVQLRPNPVRQLLHVTVDVPREDKLNIRILSVDGKVVKVFQKQLAMGNQSIDLDLSALMSGFYYVEVNTTKRYFFKVLKL